MICLTCKSYFALIRMLPYVIVMPTFFARAPHRGDQSTLRSSHLTTTLCPVSVSGFETIEMSGHKMSENVLGRLFLE